MKIQKYFGFLSYNGKLFYGSQNQKSEVFETVQGTLKNSIDKIFEKNLTEFSVRLASRTDAGVHAYKNAFDFFLKFDEGVVIYPPIVIKRALNSQFIKLNKRILNIYIPQLYLAENDFDSRKDALERKYIYKIILKPSSEYSCDEETDFLFERYFNYYINSSSKHINLDIQKIEEVIKLFEGRFYDFSNFSKLKNDPNINPTRKINKITLKIKNDLIHPNTKKLFLIFEAKSFLRSQIRLIVNTILDYSCDKITKEEILDLLLMNKINLNKFPAPPEGLYLSDIVYDDTKYDYHKKFNQDFEKEYFKNKKY